MSFIDRLCYYTAALAPTVKIIFPMQILDRNLHPVQTVPKKNKLEE